ncbi:BTAD domain-containing putative transcriptional regulator [Actinosynnema sp. NPDC053489]|uniref:AfsR/SARP family transcriptional regulator n=1 Tax=Actinosynnema sp. NPDC053489 TaxID=3363916 RepID=UPI0037CCACD0
MLEFRVLGPVEAHHDGQEVPLDGSKPRTVLTALLLADNGAVSDTQMSDFLWGDHPPATFNAQIYTYVSRLRKTLRGEVGITRRSRGYELRLGECAFDLREFEDQAAQGQTALAAGRYEEAARQLRAALRLWRGPALTGVSEHLADAEAPRLEEARIAALESRIEADLALGRHAQLLPELTRLVHQHPLQERFRAQLMTTFYRCDRQADALVLYEEGRRMLADELGIDPGSLLREVHLAILTADPVLASPRRVAV